MEKKGTPSTEPNPSKTKSAPASQALTKDLAFYKFVVNSVPTGVITVDRDLKITGFNPWAERLTGYRAEEAIGSFCGEILQGGMCDTHCPLRGVVTTQEPLSRRNPRSAPSEGEHPRENERRRVVR